MKKLLLSLTSIILLSLSILGCNKLDNIIESDLETLSANINTSDIKIELSLDKSTFKLPIDELNLKIKNNNLNEYSLGREFSIERYEEKSWFYMPFKKEISFQEDAILINAGEEINFKVDLNLLKSELQPGKYRVIKYFGTNNDEPIFLGCEFIVE